MNLNRRRLLLFMGATAGTATVGVLGKTLGLFSRPPATPTPDEVGLKFKPVQTPMPLEIEGLSATKQMEAYQTFEVVDDLLVPEGYTYDLIAAWGDPVGDSRFGYNNDYVSFVPTGENEGLLTVNFEYVSGRPWVETYAQVIGRQLPLAPLQKILTRESGIIDAFALADDDPLKEAIETISAEILTDMGVGVLGLRRNSEGQWERTYGDRDRRITGISGWKDERYLQATGPATAIFAKSNKLGYDDGLGTKIIGTFQNCSGGTTPWGTVFSAEENYQHQVPEAVFTDGSSREPKERPFSATLGGMANVFGLAGNKYGWMVEVDPAKADDYGTKHSWLGRYRHEAVAFRAVQGRPLAVYSGCDRQGGHLYKFVSRDSVRQVTNKDNSRLLTEGMLYGAQFNADGTGRWIALEPNTVVNPILPSQVEGKKGTSTIQLPNPDPTVSDYLNIIRDADIFSYKQQFKTLGDIYQGDNPLEQQGAILIDAHYAANAVGITATARPEDTAVDPRSGDLFIAFTSGSAGGDGGPDKAIFKGPSGETPYEHGWIMKLTEDQADPAAMTFQWEMLTLGGEPADGGFGFSNPDNLEIDGQGNLWMVTDMSTSKHNQAVPNRIEKGKPVSQSNLRGLFGNNAAWYIPLSGPYAGYAYPFAIGPMESELCGLFLTPDQKTLFLAPQHPGEKNGMRKNQNVEVRQFAMRDTYGQEFTQERTVPIGSNWPGKSPNDPPKPGLVAIRRLDGDTLI